MERNLKRRQFLEHITPEKAREYLRYNNKGTRNRKLDSHKVISYCSDMKVGNWRYTPDPIAFSTKDGHLMNGQHRLHAIANQNRAILCRVEYCPNDTVFDRGKARSTTDALFMNEKLDKELVNQYFVAAAKCYIKSAECMSNSYNPTDTEVENFIICNSQALLDMKSIIYKKGGKTAECRRSPIATGILAAIMNGESIFRIREFAETVNSGFSNGENDFAAITFRNQILNMKIKNKLNPMELVKLTETALFDFLNYRKRTRIYTKIEHKYIQEEPRGYWLKDRSL